MRIAVAIHVLCCTPVVLEGFFRNRIEIPMRVDAAYFTVSSIETRKLALAAGAD